MTGELQETGHCRLKTSPDLPQRISDYNLIPLPSPQRLKVNFFQFLLCPPPGLFHWNRSYFCQVMYLLQQPSPQQQDHQTNFVTFLERPKIRFGWQATCFFYRNWIWITSILQKENIMHLQLIFNRGCPKSNLLIGQIDTLEIAWQKSILERYRWWLMIL